MTGKDILKEMDALRAVFDSEDFSGKVFYRTLMSRHTSLGIGGPADVFVVPSDIKSLSHIVVAAQQVGMPFVPVGGGTNILVRDKGIRGIVLCLSGLDRISNEGSGKIRADAGVQLQKVVSFAKKSSLSGMEGLSGIPGTLGGAIAGNAGAFGYEMKDIISDITLMGTDGIITIADVRSIVFDYRRAELPEGSIILSASLQLRPDDLQEISRKTDEYLRQKKATQPIGERSAGCVFKNPSGIPAGRLIDEAGCKGLRVGAVEVSPVHANFFIAKKGATAEDFLRLMDKVARRVKEQFGIVLEPEIRILGC